MNLTYGPGAHFLVVAPGLAFQAADEHLARRVWSTIDAASGAQDLLVELVRDGLAGLGAFVLLDVREDRVRVLVRGEVTACVHDSQHAVTWSGSGVTTWAEKVFDRVDSVLIGDEAPSAGWLPMRVGIVRCGGFEFRGAAVDRAEELPLAGRQPADRSTPVTSGPSGKPLPQPAEFAPREPVVAAAPITDVAPPDAATPVDPPAPRPVSPAPTVAPRLPEPPAKPATLQVSAVDNEPGPTPNPPVVIPPPDPAQTRTESPDDGFDHLFESTIMRSVEDAAIRTVPDEAVTGSPGLDGNRPGAGEAVAAVPAGAGESSVLGARLGDHDGHTITAAQLGALRAHLPSPDPIEPPSPSDARLELSTGDVITLDRDVVIGRRPEVDRVQGGRVPTVVTVPSPRQDVSRTHLRVGWSGVKVLATDLHSMNGTVLIGAEGTSRTLDGGVPQQLADGDMLDIGDGVTLTLRLSAR